MGGNVEKLRDEHVVGTGVSELKKTGEGAPRVGKMLSELKKVGEGGAIRRLMLSTMFDDELTSFVWWLFSLPSATFPAISPLE